MDGVFLGNRLVIQLDVVFLGPGPADRRHLLMEREFLALVGSLVDDDVGPEADIDLGFPAAMGTGAAGGTAIRVVLDGSTGGAAGPAGAGRIVASGAACFFGFVRRVMKMIRRKTKAAPAPIRR